MNPDKINDHIDGGILSQLSEGMKLDEVLVYLDNKIERFSSKSFFVNVSKRYLLNNWSRIEIKKRYTTYIVIQSYKRKKDIEWIISKRSEFEYANDKALFNLIKLKEKLK